MKQEIIELKRGVEFIKNGIAKFIYLQENFPEQNLSASEFMQLYTHVYGICCKYEQKYEPEVYNLYRQIIEEYVKETVLPCLREKHEHCEILLSELVKRWKNYKAFVGWMSRLFHYLDRYFIPRRQLISLDEVGFSCFRNAVFQDINIKARDSVIYLIEQERQGAQIDRFLLKNIVDYFFEVGGKEGWNYYQKHYEEVILNSTASYYMGKAMSWITEEEDYYIQKAKECLAKEEENVSHYLHSCSKYKLLTTVQQQFLSVYEKQQLDKAKVEDLSKKLSSSCMI